ncbi:Histone deacetylase complex subunit sap18, partial [Perkinsus olseni]
MPAQVLSNAVDRSISWLGGYLPVEAAREKFPLVNTGINLADTYGRPLVVKVDSKLDGAVDRGSKLLESIRSNSDAIVAMVGRIRESLSAKKQGVQSKITGLAEDGKYQLTHLQELTVQTATDTYKAFAALRHCKAGEDGAGRAARLPSGCDDGVEGSLKVTKSTRGRLERGGEAPEGMTSAAAFLSLPVRRRSGGSVELLAADEPLHDSDVSSHHFSTELWPQGDDQTVGIGLRNQGHERAVMGRYFVEEMPSGNGSPDFNASQGPSESTEPPLGKFHEGEICDPAHGERTSDEQDAESSLDQHFINMTTDGQRFGRNSDRRRLPTAGRFGTLSFKMEPESPTVAERAMWSAPVPPPEANEAPEPAAERAVSMAASDLRRAAAHRERDLPIAQEAAVEQHPETSRRPPVTLARSTAPSILSHAALFDTSWRPTSAAYSSFASVPGCFGDTPERQASRSITTGTRQSRPSTLVLRRPSIPSGGAYKQVLSPRLTVLPAATQLAIGGREDPRGRVAGRKVITTSDHLFTPSIMQLTMEDNTTMQVLLVMAGKVPDTTINTRVNHYRSVWWFMLHTILLSLAPPLLSSFRAFPCGGGHQPSPFEMEGQNSVPWANYHLIVPQGDGDAAEQDTDVRGQFYHSGRWSDPMPPHASLPAVMELLIFVPDAIVYLLSTAEDDGDLVWTQLDIDGGFTVTRSVGAADEEQLCAAVVSLDGSSFIWSVKIDMRLFPECHGHTFHFRSTDGSVLAVWCSQPNAADRIMARVMSAFGEEPLPRREAGDDSGMSELLEILKKPISASA